MADARRPGIRVLAGTNGSGKSSLLGAFLRSRGSTYWNPDECAHQARRLNPMLTQEQANLAAWQKGVALLIKAIETASNFTLETTLGGNTITTQLIDAVQNGHLLQLVYVGLDSPERHIQRVAARVRRGGHNIPEDMIRTRYDSSRKNLVRLLPWLEQLTIFDNSVEANPHAGQQPKPACLLRMTQGHITYIAERNAIPNWAKPLLTTAMKIGRDTPRQPRTQSPPK